MSQVDTRLKQLGLHIPAPMQLPPGVTLKFPWVRVHGDRAMISGHCGLSEDGQIAPLLGKVGIDLSIEQAQLAAKLTALSILSSLKRHLGDLDRVQSWLRVFGMVNCAPSFQQHPAVLDGFSDLIIELYGRERGEHARSAVGMASLPFNISVEIEAEVAIRPNR